MLVSESCSFSARYGKAILPAGAPRTFTWNTDEKDSPDRSSKVIDWSFNLRAVGLGALRALADQNDFSEAALDALTTEIYGNDNKLALLARVILFRVTKPLYSKEARVAVGMSRRQAVAASIAAEEEYLRSIR